MGMRWRRWCPNGCGKCVKSTFQTDLNKKQIYQCERCKEIFNKIVLEKYKNE